MVGEIVENNNIFININNNIYPDLSDFVVSYIKNSILNGTLKQGDRIIESKLSKTLGISRAPLREGLKELEKMGIVTSYPRKGKYITKYDNEDIKEIFDIRLLLENNIIDILIDNNYIKEKNYDHLEKIIKNMEEIAKSQKSKEEKTLLINEKDMEFHQYIWSLSKSNRRKIILDGIFFQLRMAMLFDTNLTDDLLKTATDHYSIIEGLKEGNKEYTKKALKEHIISL